MGGRRAYSMRFDHSPDPFLNDRAGDSLAGWWSRPSRSTRTAAAFASATANGRRAAGLHNRASAFGFWTSRAIASRSSPSMSYPRGNPTLPHLSRREALAGLAASGAMSVAAKAIRPHRCPQPKPRRARLLASFGEHLLALGPEGATSLGLDTGERAQFRYHLADRSLAGQRRFADMIRVRPFASRADRHERPALCHPHQRGSREECV